MRTKFTGFLRKHLIKILFCTTSSLVLAGHYTISDELFSISLSSKSKKEEKTFRAPILTKIKPSDKMPDKQIELLLKDPAMSQRWGHLITDSQRAWRITKGSRNIIVAVIDTGIDVRHPNLADNLWTNKGEVGMDAKGRSKATNGIDDDGNGFIDDVHGWNFVANNPDLTDNHGHGTHIAGIIGAEGADGTGIMGIAPLVSIMSLKYYDPKGSGYNNLMNTVKSIEYAVKMGANIINYSGGGLEPSEEERKALAAAEKKGILVVAAAGNERSNSDVHAYYPANYPLKNIISVTAIDKEKNVLPSSNFGEFSVDLAAPGNEIYSTFPGGKYGYMTGTSQATAFVTGVAALLMANNSDLRAPERLKKYLTQTGDIDERLAGKTRYRKRLNSYRALAIKDADEALNGVRVQNAQNIEQKFAVPEEAEGAEIKMAGMKAQLTQSSRDILKVLAQSPEAQSTAQVGLPQQN